MLTGSTGQAIRAWDSDAWQEQAQFVGHTGEVTGLFAVANSADKTVFSTGSDKAIRMWSLARAAVTGTRMAGHESWVTSLVLTPDGKKLVSGSWDGTVPRVWDVETAKETGQMESHQSKIYAVAVSRDGKRAASAGGNGEVFVWSLETNEELVRLEGHDEESEVNGSRSRHGKRVVTAASDGDIRVWDAESGKELAKIKGPREGILAFALSPDGKKAVVSVPGHACLVYDLETKKELFQLRGTRTRFKQLLCDGARIVTGAADRTLRLWDSANGRRSTSSPLTPAMSVG